MAKEIKEKDPFVSLVNGEKLMRAQVAVGQTVGKPMDDACAVLLGQAKKEGLSGDDAVIYIYKGLGGLVNEAQATVNRANEAKLAKAKRSR